MGKQLKNIYKEYIFLKKPLKLQINTVASQYNDSDTHYHWFINSIATFLFEKKICFCFGFYAPCINIFNDAHPTVRVGDSNTQIGRGE